MAPRTSYSSNRSKGFTIGIICILIGILLLGFNTGYLPMTLKPIVFSWPMLLVVLGIVQLSRRKYIGGCVFILLGVCCFIPDISTLLYNLHLHLNFKIIFPIILMIIGVTLLLKRR